MNFPRVSIIILNYNGLFDTIECLESLEKCTYPNFEIILIDNGSPDTTQAGKLGQIKMKNLRVFVNKTNLGFAGGNNCGIKKVFAEAKSKYIYFLNNDTTVEPDFLLHVVEAAEKNQQIGIVGSLSLQYFNRDLVENAGHDFLNCGDYVPRGRNKLRGDFQKPCGVMGVCSAGALYKVETLRECGMYDESFFLNYEDADLCMRCILYGWKCFYEPKSVIYHKLSVSVAKFRDYTLNIRGHYNLLKTYFYNTPALVILLNLPFILIRDIAVIFGTIIFLRFQIFNVFIHARLRFLCSLPTILRERKWRMKHRKISSWYLLKHQKNFFNRYISYFIDFILRNKRHHYEFSK